MLNTKQQHAAVAFYWGNRKTGSLALIMHSDRNSDVTVLTNKLESPLALTLKPILIGMTAEGQSVWLDPKSKAIEVSTQFPCDAFPAHVYSDPHSPRDWFMNDGDKETGNDTLNCGDKGSSVTVIEQANTKHARYLGTICVGRGHHQTAFTWPSEHAPKVPQRIYISNLNDGTLSIIGNDPSDKARFLTLLETINLCEADNEDGKADIIPNRAFPHGLAYSPLTGKVYNLNSGYGTLLTIDPITGTIENRIELKGFSNVFMVPGGRYLIGRSADRKLNPEHVIAKMIVFDVTTNQIVATLDLPDIYLSKYYFNVETSKLYFTTSASGSPAQQANLKKDVLLCFDLTQLPLLTAPHEIPVGSIGTLAFKAVNGKTQAVFASDGERGELVVMDGISDDVIERIKVGPGASHSRIWSVE